MDGITNSHIALGHTRTPTQGSPKDNDNNHPVESDNWILVHNGSVSQMPRLPGYKYKGEVDSEVLVSYIEKYGLKEGLPYVERGTASVAVMNKNDLNTAYLWRETSPVELAYDDKTKTLFFASQENFLRKGLANILILFTSFQIRSLPSNLLIKVKLNPLTIEPLGNVAVMKYTYNKNIQMGYWGTRQETAKPLDLKFNPETNRWEIASASKVAPIVGLQELRIIAYLKNNGFTDAEITRMTAETKAIIISRSYNGTDIQINNEGQIHPLKTSISAETVSNRYYLGRISQDFKSWIKLDAPNRGYISIDGTLIKKWDKEKQSHYIIELDGALDEELIDEAAFKADIDFVDEQEDSVVLDEEFYNEN